MNRRHFIASAGGGLFAQAPAGPRAAVHAHIDANITGHIERIQEYVRQPSISAEHRGIKECAELTRKYLAAAGCQQTALVSTPGHPGVWGQLDSGAPKSLIVYWMYDVQPVTESEWASPPFDARLIAAPSWGMNGRILRGRGAQNQKGPELAFLSAVESIKAVHGRLPVNLMFLCEGEEELGSPNMPLLVEKYKDRLSNAAGVLFPSTNLGRDGRASFALGNKGIVYLELESRGGPHGGPQNADVHSSVKAAVDSPVWRLVQALASMTDASGNQIRVEGLSGMVRQPTAREREIFEEFLKGYDEVAARAGMHVEKFAANATKREALWKLWFDSSLNVDGVWAGYTGPGTKTILPHKANAKIDFRLVPDQAAPAVASLVRKHLDQHGFTDVKINWWNGYDPSQADPDNPMMKAALDLCREHGIRTQVAVRTPGSAPHYLFTRDLKLPLLMFGLGHGGGAHSKDEFLVIDATPPRRGLEFLEKGFVDFLYRFAEA